MLPTRRPALSPALAGYRGHAHFWERAMSRRQFIGTAAAASGVALTSTLWMPVLAQAEDSIAPKPIGVGTLPPFHVWFFGDGQEISTITDFKGSVGVAQVQGTGTGRGGSTGDGPLLFDSDMRFMKGSYVGVDGQTHQGTFGFI
jgi:hypothetical protein